MQSVARAQPARAPIAIPTIGTEAIPTANAIEVSMNSSRAPMPYPARISVPNRASIWVKMVTASTDCRGEKQETAPTFRISKNMPRRIRSPLSIGVTRARPEKMYHAMMVPPIE